MRRSQVRFVNAINHGCIHIRLGGLGEQYFICTLHQVLLGSTAVGERARALQHHVYIEITPGQIIDIRTAQ